MVSRRVGLSWLVLGVTTAARCLHRGGQQPTAAAYLRHSTPSSPCSYVAGWHPRAAGSAQKGRLRSSREGGAKTRGRGGAGSGQQREERLAALFDLVDPGSRVADVGCDHGLLTIMLLQKCSRVIGIDVAQQPLNNALLTATKAGLIPSSSPSSSLELRLGDGMSCLSPGEVDTVCIAGLGMGSLIKILEDKGPPPASAARRLRELSVRTVVIQPYRPTLPSMVELRVFLAQEGVAIEDETLLRLRGRFYITLRLAPTGLKEGSGVREEEELVLGCHLRRRALNDATTRMLYQDYLRHHLKWHDQLITKRTCDSKRKRDRLYLDVIQHELDILGNQPLACPPPIRQP